jgi:beta-glucosidase
LKSKVERPGKELKGFQRVLLRPGETKSVQIPLKASTLAFWDESQSQWVVEEEPVKILVGRSSADIRLTRNIDAVP